MYRGTGRQQIGKDQVSKILEASRRHEKCIFCNQVAKSKTFFDLFEKHPLTSFINGRLLYGRANRPFMLSVLVFTIPVSSLGSCTSSILPACRIFFKRVCPASAKAAYYPSLLWSFSKQLLSPHCFLAEVTSSWNCTKSTIFIFGPNTLMTYSILILAAVFGFACNDEFDHSVYNNQANIIYFC